MPFIQCDGQPRSKQCLQKARAFPSDTKRKRRVMEKERIKNQERGGKERIRSDLMAGFSNVHVCLFTSAQHLVKNGDLESAGLEWDLGF